MSEWLVQARKDQKQKFLYFLHDCRIIIADLQDRTKQEVVMECADYICKRANWGFVTDTEMKIIEQYYDYLNS